MAAATNSWFRLPGAVALPMKVSGPDREVPLVEAATELPQRRGRRVDAWYPEQPTWPKF